VFELRLRTLAGRSGRRRYQVDQTEALPPLTMPCLWVGSPTLSPLSRS